MSEQTQQCQKNKVEKTISQMISKMTTQCYSEHMSKIHRKEKNNE